MKILPGIKLAAIVTVIATAVAHLLHLISTWDYWANQVWEQNWTGELGLLVSILDLSAVLGFIGAAIALTGLIVERKQLLLAGALVLVLRFVVFYAGVNIYQVAFYSNLGWDLEFDMFWVPVLDFFTKEPANATAFFWFIASIHLALVAGGIGVLAQKPADLISAGHPDNFVPAVLANSAFADSEGTTLAARFCAGCGHAATAGKFCANCGAEI